MGRLPNVVCETLIFFEVCSLFHSFFAKQCFQIAYVLPRVKAFCF